MTAALVGVCAALVLGGAMLLVLGIQDQSDQAESGHVLDLWTTLKSRWARVDNQARVLASIGAVAGVVTALVTSWLPSMLIVPLVIMLLPSLLADPKNDEIALLEALDRWVRVLTASIATGKSIAEAIRTTTRQSPERLRPALELVNARLDEHWTLPEALVQLGEELASPDADQVIAALIIAARRGGVGIRGTLTALAQSMQDTLASRREVLAEQAKPRIVVRQVTVITLLALGASIVSNPGYFAPYTHGIGQVIAVVLVGCYLAALIMLRRMSRPTKRERILRLDVAGGRHG